MIIKQLIDQLTLKNYKVYLLFIILTFILWFAIQMVKTYQYKSEIFVKITETPNRFLIDTSVQKVDINIKATGLKLWSYNIKKNIKIPFQEFNRDSIELSISSNQLITIFSDFFKIEEENISLNQNFLKYNYRKKHTKTVVIKPSIEYTFSQGYNSIDSIRLMPDSVMISGSKKHLKDITHISTENSVLNNISDTLNGVIKLKRPNQNITLSLEEVKYTLPVERYSEKAIMVDIQIINQPDSININIFPNQAKVTFPVSLKNFDKISGLDFKIIVDYNKRFEDNAVIIPEIITYPNNILKPKLHVRKVDYLIRQKK